MSQNPTYSIDFHGLKVGTGSEFGFGIPSDFFDRWPESEIVRVLEGEVYVYVLRHASMMELTVTIDAEVVLTCDRCLDEFMLPVHFEGHPVVKISDSIPDGERYSGDAHQTANNSDGDILWITPADDTLDLGQYIYESIMLSLPFQRVHPELKDCNPEMLKRFQIVSAEEFDHLVTAESVAVGSDDNEEKSNPFAKLAELKDKDK